ncbi:pyrimidine dimer DNA glycosylase/endonuclease V [Rathayibacter sp. YIM 133350]|uniref:pyrimidine dimer DNA glycosylase/endonuclease V n=1 Tax=Rathayibacter sp. YIM 133350 TaxID=3131992 RepID=UPI00307CFB0C
MRLWSLHPEYLDTQGLTACWREGLLAQKVLAGGTRGYTAHPQLVRFRAAPAAAIQTYLHAIADEADARGYRFDRSRVSGLRDTSIRIPVTSGQVLYEREHLTAKLRARSPEWLERRLALVTDTPEVHPLFTVVAGDIEAWEVLTAG